MRKLHILLYVVIICVIILSIIQVTSSYAQESLTGDWEGYINVQGQKLSIITHFDKNDTALTGTIDIPQQMAKNIKLQNISVFADDSVAFDFFAGMGIAEFRGTFENSSSITGTFIQNNQKFPFKLSQQPSNKDLPYNEQNITIRNSNITLQGTLTIPENPPSSCIILLSGSGPQDRDSNVFGFKIFQQLADYLTRNGIAVFRYDDRGTRNSSGSYSNTSLQDHVSDLSTIIDTLKQKQPISNARIGILGHSQGGIIAGKFAAQHPKRISYMILMASPAQPLSEIVIQQVESLNEKLGLDEQEVQQQVALQKAIFDTLRGSRDFSRIKEILIKQTQEKIEELPDSQKSQIPNPRSYAKSQTQQQLNQLKSPSYISFLDYNPAKDLALLNNIPTLVLYGEKDTQVPVTTNKPIAQKALKKSENSFKINVIQSANHLFQKAKTGSVREYSSLEKSFIDEFLKNITVWIKKHGDQ